MREIIDFMQALALRLQQTIAPYCFMCTNLQARSLQILNFLHSKNL
jgi:hypothetical protein